MAKSPIFNDIARSDSGYALQGEPHFPYLNRSARPIAGMIRAMLDGWFEHYPKAHHDEWIARFRGKDVDHLSAFFELMLHELMRRRGHTILEVHPKLAHTEKRPEFLMATPNKTEFILEALNVMGISDEDAKAVTRVNEVLQLVEKLDSPNHYLSIGHRKLPRSNLPVAKIKADLMAYVAALPPDGAGKQFLFEREDFHFRVRATLRAKPAPPGARPVAGISPGARYAEAVDDMKDKLGKKITKYGQLGVPYVIGVNRFGPSYKIEKIDEVLFGRALSDDAPAPATRDYTRAYDGLLINTQKPRNTRLSAVLAFEDVTPWQLPHRRGLLIENPWAKHETPALDLGVDICTVTKLGVATRVQGAPLKDLFETAAQVDEGY